MLFSTLSTLNNDLGGFSFGITADGKPGYRKPGADAVTPFIDKYSISSTFYAVKNRNNGTAYAVNTLTIKDSQNNVVYQQSANSGNVSLDAAGIHNSASGSLSYTIND